MPSGLPKPVGKVATKSEQSLRRKRGMSDMFYAASPPKQTIPAAPNKQPLSHGSPSTGRTLRYGDLGPPPQPLPLKFPQATQKLERTASLRRAATLSGPAKVPKQATPTKQPASRGLLPPGSVLRHRELGPPPQPLPLKFPSASPKHLERTTSVVRRTETAPEPAEFLVHPAPEGRKKTPPSQRPIEQDPDSSLSDLSRGRSPRQQSPSEESSFLDDESLASLHSSVLGLGMRIQKLAQGQNLGPKKTQAPQALCSTSNGSSHRNSVSVEEAAKVKTDGDTAEGAARASPPSSPISLLFTADPAGADHVDFRAAFVPASSPKANTEPTLRKKPTLALLSTELTSLERIEAALDEAQRIQSSAAAAVAQLEAELDERVREAETILREKGVVKGGKPEEKVEKVKIADAMPTIHATITPIPEEQNQKQAESPQVRAPAPQHGRSRALTDAEREDILRRIRWQKEELGEKGRWEEARRKGGAVMFLAGSK
ncbi:MAG: hypothetical protein LQ340_005834 [Diploschistes diacapsis]|nr:MAG: hypothetical protein LQ340_005834 [Diploschistes diacapsis]